MTWIVTLYLLILSAGGNAAGQGAADDAAAACAAARTSRRLAVRVRREGPAVLYRQPALGVCAGAPQRRPPAPHRRHWRAAGAPGTPPINPSRGGVPQAAAAAQQQQRQNGSKAAAELHTAEGSGRPPPHNVGESKPGGHSGSRTRETRSTSSRPDGSTQLGEGRWRSPRPQGSAHQEGKRFSAESRHHGAAPLCGSDFDGCHAVGRSSPQFECFRFFRFFRTGFPGSSRLDTPRRAQH